MTIGQEGHTLSLNYNLTISFNFFFSFCCFFYIPLSLNGILKQFECLHEDDTLESPTSQSRKQPLGPKTPGTYKTPRFPMHNIKQSWSSLSTHLFKESKWL